MSADNVTPIHPAKREPPTRPPRKPRFRRSKIGIAFANDEKATAFRAWLGLKGVCRALDAVEGDGVAGLEEFSLLSSAAALLVDMLEELQI